MAEPPPPPGQTGARRTFLAATGLALITPSAAPATPATPTAAVPVGAVLPFIDLDGAIRVPFGWVVCDGTAITGEGFPEHLFGRSPFYGREVPDLRGEFLRGADDMGGQRRARGVDSGRRPGSTQHAAVQQHAHGHTLTVDTRHRHRCLGVYPVPGTIGPNITPGGQRNTDNSLLAGYPYNAAPGAHREPFQEPGTYNDAAGERVDPRMLQTSTDGRERQGVSGEVGRVTGATAEGETRPRNYAVIFIVRII